jgi:hypothetical protein
LRSKELGLRGLFARRGPGRGRLFKGASVPLTSFRANAGMLYRLNSITPQVMDEARAYLGPDLDAVAVASPSVKQIPLVKRLVQT